MSLKIINQGNYSAALKELKDDKNNSVCWINNQTFSSLKGALNNCIFTIKDVFATSFAPTQASSKLLENFKPSYNATVVEKLINTGAFPIAKVHSDELALGGTGTFSAFGLVKNKLDDKRLSGGSSSGSVSTFTNNISFALASDTGDSVRLPASYNGCVGFKPSYGAISRYGMFAYSSSLDTVSYFAHNVNDISIISQCAYGQDSLDMTSVNVKIDNIKKTKPKKVAFLDVTNHLKEYVKKSYLKAFEKIKDDNITVEMVKIDEDLLKSIKPVYDIVSYSEASSNLANLTGIGFGKREEGQDWEEIMTNTRSKNLGKMVQRRLSLGSYYLYSENQKDVFLKAQKVRRVIKNYYTNLHDKFDLIIYPASADIAPLIDEKYNNSYMDYILTGANLVGNPSLSIPLGSYKNMPYNLTIDSKIYNDEKLLSYSLHIEELLGGKHE
ncbi:amidase family protein [Mycoplasma crocodyli]|uniref:Glutamyl-tRNA(Gln) and/or aspartyl-tRNA(Asn) amidotransferase, A subunit n=1 Tax=Mycoplasma crocodyli (strain ATCC 51981 / MP145) TaxID=512564 RepID=D5E5U2_MYCCM|nr:amidase family protein [Mycoplasma crocodyli]ADE19707.1 glutamyl-tRNA(Gln) and/or aspartyl-tRNA(Asn) amidotransferase, A subunit [Mycoplasma crocodyli MP145]